MVKISKGKFEFLEQLSDKNGVIAALAIDQRGSLKKMIGAAKGSDATVEELSDFKTLVSKELTPYASAILLDPEFGIPAGKARAASSGLLTSYEKTGYDATEPGRIPDLLPNWSVKRIKENGGTAVKLLVYFDPDEPDEINDVKKAFVERVGSECEAEQIPLFLEIVTYDEKISDKAEYAKVKPHKVIESVKVFTEPRYGVDVLKLEVPVDMSRVEGVGENEPVYSAEEAKKYFLEVEKTSPIPYIWLSAGVSAELFQKTLVFAKEAGSKYNGVLCGRATWRGGVEAYGKGGEAGAVEWLRTEGKKNIEDLNEILAENATPWYDKFGGKDKIEVVD
ncbi:tagatose-bisphosphate aldolase [Sporolactobacillus sp. CPB3-1]|uniref:Tagatose 1,6-diphosphate aldolase n=1 Tax=Sporolactobacillus mangiferae TaxID=2940498 RepID=A0ABT0MEH3_9BACL|nr:tagatose-bisphosphate aldolase [Sporolactobacillus mangiferae]MCL1632674.1 tagatose-bisphosphate aldolase [Sporolactobacillus mangiferae]